MSMPAEVQPLSTGRILVVQHEPDAPAGQFGDWWQERGILLEYVRPLAGDEVPSFREYDGVLVLGGAMAPYDDTAFPWLVDERQRIAEGVENSVPLLGICLGAQLLAMACGGEVRRGLNGPEVGVCSLEPLPAAATDAVFQALPPAARVVQWHWEEISSVPPGATLLVTGAQYPHQAYRVGTNAWGVQGHPEVTVPIAADWGAQGDSELLRLAGRTPESIVREIADNANDLAQAWRPVADAFASVVLAHAGARTAAT